jgi:hypothetical protein
MAAVFRKFLLFFILNFFKRSCLVFGAHYNDTKTFLMQEVLTSGDAKTATLLQTYFHPMPTAFWEWVITQMPRQHAE